LTAGRKAFIAGLIAGAAVAVALLATIGPLADLLPSVEGESRADEARQVIEDSYFRPTTSEQLENASIDGMVRTISRKNDDKFSHYFDPAAYERFQASSSGQFSGIGLGVNETKRGLRVAQVYDGSPAQKAGIDVGDQIVAVNGESIAGVSSTESSNRIKGPPGTTVEITVVDAKTGKRRDLEVERANVRIPAVVSRMKRDGGHKIGYVALLAFSEGAHGELRTAIERLRRRGADGLVLDLRGNGGGLLKEAVLVQSIFQEEGPVVTIEGRSRPKETLDATGGALDREPMAVLVDNNTASASEIVTAALKENDLATVIGETTYGKGVFQEVIPLDAGGALDITVGEYLTADGTSILGKGVKPDEVVRDRNPQDGDEVLDAGLDRVASELPAS
jgi:carboxyl-terminal processing protease